MRLVGFLLLSACAAPRHAAPKAAPIPKPHLTVDIGSDVSVEQRVVVRLELEGLGGSTFRFRPMHPAAIVTLEARDAAGTIAVHPSADGFELARRPSGKSSIRYVLDFKPATTSDGIEPHAEPIELRVIGHDVLALPDLEERVPITIRVRTGVLQTGGASSFGLGVEQNTTARPSDLRDAYFIAGDVGTASFHAADGDDSGAWIGFTAFDPRWVSAISAGVRSAVDAYVGRSGGVSSPPLSILFNASKERRPAPVVVRSAPHGLIVSVDPRASWSANARLLVAQALVQRYVGSFLWVGDRRDEASGRFFSAGFSRAIARDVLTDVGLLDPTERANEINALLAASVFPTTDAPLLDTARGALVATSLGGASLKTLVRDLLADAANTHRDTIPRAEFLAKLRTGKLEAALDGKAEAELPSDLLGPCFRLVRKDLVPFELGFVTSTDLEMKIESVKPGSRAAAAGVRAGDVVDELHYEDGQGNVPVDLTLTRAGKKLKLHFMPAGPSHRGRTFERIPGIPDQRC